jgi:hypothetical protein
MTQCTLKRKTTWTTMALHVSRTTILRRSIERKRRALQRNSRLQTTGYVCSSILPGRRSVSGHNRTKSSTTWVETRPSLDSLRRKLPPHIQCGKLAVRARSCGVLGKVGSYLRQAFLFLSTLPSQAYGDGSSNAQCAPTQYTTYGLYI